MLKLNRTTEYGLVALRHIYRKSLEELSGVTSAREVADRYGLPFEITAKTMQRLKDRGFIESEQGARGGYSIKKSLDEITLEEFLRKMEGRRSVVVCTGKTGLVGGEAKACGCEYHAKCEIRGMMEGLDSRILSFLSQIRLSDLVTQHKEKK